MWSDLLLVALSSFGGIVEGMISGRAGGGGEEGGGGGGAASVGGGGGGAAAAAAAARVGPVARSEILVGGGGHIYSSECNTSIDGGPIG